MNKLIDNLRRTTLILENLDADFSFDDVTDENIEVITSLSVCLSELAKLRAKLEGFRSQSVTIFELSMQQQTDLDMRMDEIRLIAESLSNRKNDKGLHQEFVDDVEEFVSVCDFISKDNKGK